MIEQYQTRARAATTLPQGKKDISEVYDAFGSHEVQRIIAEAQGISDADIYDLSEHKEDILDIMMGNYDRGYEVGMGGLTDGIFHPTSDGGLIILTGRPNSQKDGFPQLLSDGASDVPQPEARGVLLVRETYQGQAREGDSPHSPGGEEHGEYGRRRIARRGKAGEPQGADFLSEHMVDFDTKTRLPDSNYIIGMMEAMMNRKKQKIDYLVIDPYVFINMTEGGSRHGDGKGETDAGRSCRHGAVRATSDGGGGSPENTVQGRSRGLSAAGYLLRSGQCAGLNLADFLLTVNRISKPEEGKMFTIVEMLKVRDQSSVIPKGVLRAPALRQIRRK